MMSKGNAVYLDYAAATPLDDRVLTAMQPFLGEIFYNPSAAYTAAAAASRSLDAARAEIGHWLGAKQSEIIFTAGGTEANNLAIHGIMRRFPDANVVVSAIEHESVLAPAERYDYREVVADANGRIDIPAIQSKIDDKTVLVSIMYANNEIGTVQLVHEIGQLIAGIRKQRQKNGNKLPLYFHSDAAQAANYLDLHVARLGVDLMTLNGGKIYGPKQSGALYVKAGVELEPLIDGGGQERGLRSGTENVAAAAGFAKALDIAQSMRREEVTRLQALQKKFIKDVEEQLPYAVINGSRAYRLPNNIHLTLPGQDNERLLIELDEAGIMAAAGSACSASSEESSHVLHALGLDDAAARSSLRFTMGRQTDERAIEKVLKVLNQLLG
jgi:cysteine desulfurase